MIDLDFVRAQFPAFAEPSTSQNTYVLAQAMRKRLRPGDEIVVTNQDHEANSGVWRRLAVDRWFRPVTRGKKCSLVLRGRVLRSKA